MNTPIHERASEFAIVSAEYSWRHKTMTWKEASDHVASMYETIRNSTVLPLYDFDFWCIPYLLGRGFSKQQINGFVRTASAMLIDELSGPAVEANQQIGRLVAALYSERGHGEGRRAARPPASRL
jgi:p-methyltransferase